MRAASNSAHMMMVCEGGEARHEGDMHACKQRLLGVVCSSSMDDDTPLSVCPMVGGVFGSYQNLVLCFELVCVHTRALTAATLSYVVCRVVSSVSKPLR